MEKTIDITHHMLRFREAVRHNWNTYFFNADDVMDADISAAFCKVEKGLFQGVVLCTCNILQADANYGSELAAITVTPRPEHLGQIFLQIGTRSESGMAWEAPVSFEVKKDSRFKFVRFFDWNPYEQISLSLVEVQVVQWDGTQNIVGCRALTEVSSVSFLISE